MKVTIDLTKERVIELANETLEAEVKEAVMQYDIWDSNKISDFLEDYALEYCKAYLKDNKEVLDAGIREALESNMKDILEESLHKLRN